MKLFRFSRLLINQRNGYTTLTGFHNDFLNLKFKKLYSFSRARNNNMIIFFFIACTIKKLPPNNKGSCKIIYIAKSHFLFSLFSFFFLIVIEMFEI